MSIISRAAKVAAALGFTAIAVVAGSGIANADEWPTVPDYPTPIVPYETKAFLTPTDLDYYNPFIAQDRLTSPYGTSTRIVCQGFHGVTTDCWQADAQGNPHKLIALPYDLPNITGSFLPGGGPKHFVFPLVIPGS